MFDAPVFIAPGISRATSQGTVSHSGSITCIGSIDGHEITGPGRLEESGTYMFTNTIEWTGALGRFQ